MKQMNVMALIRKGLEPPDTVDDLTEDEAVSAPWKTEFDVIATLEDLGHTVRRVSVYDDVSVIRDALEERMPRIAFNLLEEFAGEALFDQNVVTYLELKGVRYTGCNPRGMMISRDKALSKKLLVFHRIRVPAFAVFQVGRRVRRPKQLKFPLFVKSVFEDASLGISQASLVRDDASLEERVRFVHEHANTPAIAEEFIEGRELYVGVVGNRRLEVLPPWELLFDKKPEDVPLIATARAKWNLRYQKKWGVTSRAASDLSDELRAEIVRQCKRIYRILGMSGYARLDFRLSPEGKLYFLEANANPQLSYGEDFAESAKARGIDYEQLITRILRLGLRWQPVWMS